MKSGISDEPETGGACGVVVVGAGQAGHQAAASLRQGGYAGVITLIGDEAALPYQRPPLSKAYLKPGGSDADLPLGGEGFYAHHRITVLRARKVLALDRSSRRVLLEGGAAVPYKTLVLSTGARNRRLDAPGGSAAGIFYLRDADEARALKAALGAARRVLVVGGGFLGLEVASTALSYGREVTVLEAGARLMGRAVSKPVSEHAYRFHTEAGMDIRLNTGVLEFLESGGTVRGAVTNEGSRLAADLVFVAIGVLPNVALAEESGLHVSGGIVVDEFLRTADPHIYAIGDCALFPSWADSSLVRLESVQNALDHARCAAAGILGSAQPYRALPWFWSDQGLWRLKIAGLARPGDEILRRESGNGFSIYGFRDGALAFVESVNAPADHVRARRLLSEGRQLTAQDLEVM